MQRCQEYALASVLKSRTQRSVLDPCFPAVLVLLAVLAVAAVRVLVPGMLGKWCTNVGCGRRRDESDCALLLLLSVCCWWTFGSVTPSATPWAASTTLPDSMYASLSRNTYHHDVVHAASVRRAPSSACALTSGDLDDDVTCANPAVQ